MQQENKEEKEKVKEKLLAILNKLKGIKPER